MIHMIFLGLFLSSGIPEYSVSCEPAQFEYMMENFQEEIEIPCTVTHEGTVYEDCTMRIRGDSSREYRKKSYRIEFPPDSPLMGRTSWNFNAEFEDHSYMRSWLFSRILTRMGFPVFQVSHARLNINGEYRGLYILLEPVNESFLVRNSMDPGGRLYKARLDGACASIHDDVDSLWSSMTGSGTGMNDLVELIEGIEYCPVQEFSVFMDSTFEMYGDAGLVRMLAINSAFANNSTYYHNYYLYHDVTGSSRWMMLPWDVDKVLSDNLGIAYGGCTNRNWYDNPLNSRTLTVPCYREAFQESVVVIYRDHLTQENLAVWSDSLEDVLRQAIEDDEVYDDTDFSGFQAALSELAGNLSARETDLMLQFQYKYHPFTADRSDSITADSLEVSWRGTVDPMGNPASYTVLVRDSLGPGSNEIARFEGIQDTVFTIAGLPQGNWWWTVETNPQGGWRRTEATDRYNPFQVIQPTELEGTLSENTVLEGYGSPYTITSSLSIPEGITLTIRPGVHVLMGEGAFIDCGGSLFLQGTPDDSVYISALHSGEPWGGMKLESGSLTAEHAVISGSRGYSQSPGSNFAAVVGYSSSVTISGSVFRNNWCCVKLHGGAVAINGSRFLNNRGEMFFMEQGEGALISSSVFENLYDPVAGSMDGIEFHLCTGGDFLVENCTVSGIDGDCIDMNASTVTISGTTVSGSTDKGFSIGAPTGGGAAGTLVTVENSVVRNCPTGVAVKDGAGAMLQNLLFNDCEQGLSVYEKTQGMGGGNACVSNTVFSMCPVPVAVEQGSAMVSWSLSDTEPLTGEGNITGDPFMDPGGYLLWNSPCINGGDPSIQDPDGSRSDMGPFFYPVSMRNLFVNELMARNDTVILDDWGRTSDWIELYNGNDYDLDAGVLVFMESDSSGAAPWSVPRGTMIPRGGYMLFWADGDGWKGGTHLPFRLSAGGDGFSIGRNAPGAGDTPFVSVLEEVSFQEQTADLSIGRFPDGGPWQTLDTPTPGYSNGSPCSGRVLLAQPRPNPAFGGTVTMDLEAEGGLGGIMIFDLAGRRVATLFQGELSPGSSTFHWQTDSYPCGVYIVFATCAGHLPATAKVTVLR